MSGLGNLLACYRVGVLAGPPPGPSEQHLRVSVLPEPRPS